MKVSFYLHHSMLKAGGIFTYSIGILRLFIESGRFEKIQIVFSENLRSYVQENFARTSVIEHLEIKRFSFLNRTLFGASYLIYDWSVIYKLQFRPRMRLFLEKISSYLNPYGILDKQDTDLVYVPLQFSPIYRLSKPLVTTYHDLQELHFPENFSPAERLHRAINSQKSLEQSSHVIVSFQHVKEDVLKYFDVPSSKVSVCLPPIHQNWFGTTDPNKVDVRKKYQIVGTFVLYPAATWPHKNHEVLLKAMMKLAELGHEITLVCTGHKTDYFTFINDLYKDTILANSIKFLGIVPEEDLISLYQETDLVVIPTKYEAGSGPLYEAMKLGSPVICANTTSLPETIDNSDYLFDHDDEKKLAQLILRMLIDSDFRDQNLTNSKGRLKYYASFNSIDPFEKAFEKTLNT